MRYGEIDFKHFGGIWSTPRPFYALKTRLEEKNLYKTKPLKESNRHTITQI